MMGGFIVLYASWRMGNALDAKLGVFIVLLAFYSVRLIRWSLNFGFLFPLLPSDVLHGWIALLFSFTHCSLLTHYPAMEKWEWQSVVGFLGKGLWRKFLGGGTKNTKGNGRYIKSYVLLLARFSSFSLNRNGHRENSMGKKEAIFLVLWFRGLL